MLEGDVPLAEALRLAGEGVVDADIDRTCRRMAGDVEEGLTLSQACRRRGLLPSGTGSMLQWAEAHRSLPEALHMLGELFEGRARTQAGVVASVTSVLTVLLILFGIAFTVGALLVPMITLISKLSG